MYKVDFKPEILAPAGDMESVQAAVLNGATAVYLGGRHFSARQNAKNFDDAELETAVSYCHARGVLVYLTLNTLVFDTQIDQVENAIVLACDSGCDGIIVQDLALLTIIKRNAPSMPVHASTQMSVHTLEGAKWLKAQGFSRVVLARELSFEQIREITQNSGIETEVFVHGALCMSMSGQCYVSALIGEHSGNRGNCAGTCRMPFSSTDSLSFDLSLKDLCLIDYVQKLKDVGVTSLKIEGRMKRPEYVAATSNAYKSAVLGEPYDIETLQSIFSRSGFSDGYFTDSNVKERFGTRRKEDVTAATAPVLKALQNTYQKEVGTIPISMHLTVHKDKIVYLTAVDCDGNEAKSSADPPAVAINRETTEQDGIASLQKLGGTIFVPDCITCDIEKGLMLPMSKINEMRRVCCDKILHKREQIVKKAYKSNMSDVYIDESDAYKMQGAPKIWLRYRTFSQISPSAIQKCEYFSLPINEVLNHVDMLAPYKEKLLLEPDRMMIARERGTIRSLTELKGIGFSNIICNNYAHIKVADDLGFKKFGGAFLNCTNSIAAFEFAQEKMEAQTLSFECSLATMQKIKATIPLGIIAYGYIPLMLLKTCPLKNQGDCMDCKNNAKQINSETVPTLTDRLSKKFPIICNEKHYSELLNCTPLYLADRKKEFASFAFLTYYFTTETRNQCDDIIVAYENGVPAKGEFTRGLYYRKV